MEFHATAPRGSTGACNSGTLPVSPEVFVILVFALTSLLASSMPPLRVPTAVVSEFGIYVADIQVINDSQEGPQVYPTSEIKLKTTTTKIPAQPDIKFGFRATVTNPTTDHWITVSETYTHPPFTGADGKVHTVETANTIQVGPGETTTVEPMWFFIKECPYEFVPGKWTFTITIDGQPAVTKDFEVYKPEAGAPK